MEKKGYMDPHGAKARMGPEPHPAEGWRSHTSASSRYESGLSCAMGPLGARYTMPHTRARLGTQHRAHSPVPRLQTQGVHHRTHVTRTQHQAHTLGRKHWPHTGPHSRPTRVDTHTKHASPNTQHQHHNTGTQSQAYNDSPASWAHAIGTHTGDMPGAPSRNRS